MLLLKPYCLVREDEVPSRENHLSLLSNNVLEAFLVRRTAPKIWNSIRIAGNRGGINYLLNQFYSIERQPLTLEKVFAP